MQQQQCKRCILDTTIPGIKFDEEGVCNYCAIHDEMERQYPNGDEGKKILQDIVKEIKKAGKNREYDCVVGVSGGRDSTYALYISVMLGLRPLAVHFDNGWNSATASTNISQALNKLGVDLETIVADWSEFKDLQLSFLKASTCDAEIPTDVAIMGSLHKIAAKHNIKYIMNGHSFRTEGVAPLTWTYMDGRYINKVQEMFSGRKLKTIPNFTIWDMFYYTFIKGIKVIPLLNYVEYEHKVVNEVLERELGWTYYGGHHHESHYTHFFHSYYLPQKFNIDMRKLELSALIRSGQINRETALETAQKPYQFSEELIEYTCKKLGLTEEQLTDLMKEPVKSFEDYPTYYPLITKMHYPISIAAKTGLIPRLLYYKFFPDEPMKEKARHNNA